MIMRPGTQDWQAWQEVVRDNCYRLPKKFESADVIIDIGAHIGCFAIACLQRGASKVVCYEPDTDNFRLLLMNTAHMYGQAVCHNKAVWHRDDEQLYLTRDMDGYSAMHHTMYDAGRGGIAVPSVAFDDIMRPYDSVRLVKLDCEGAEVPIIGMSTLLARAQEIVGELHYGRVPHITDLDQQVYCRLTDLGFTVQIEPSPTHPKLIAHFWARRQE